MGSPVLTSSLWSQQLAPKYPPLTDSRTADVVVVGAGIAGLLTAALLHRSGHDVVVIDRDIVGGVATRNTTAKVSALQGTTLSHITKARGETAASSYAAAQVDAVDGLRALINTLAIDCAMTPATAVTFALETGAGPRVTQEQNAALAAGLPVTWMASLDVPFETHGGLMLENQFHINPASLCVALAEGLGVGHIFEHTTVASIAETKADGCVVTTDHGQRVTAQHVVIATQSPIVDPMFLANRCEPKQSYAIAVRTKTVPEAMYLSADDFTISLRPAIVGGEQLLIVGGNGHPMAKERTTNRWTELERWAEQHIGAVDVAHRWATHDLVATDHVPFIGRLTPNARRRWVATAFGKWGMTNAYVAARIIRDGIDQKERAPWASTFDSTRIRSTLNRELLSAGVNAVQHIVGDRVTRRPEPRCSHQGCVLRKDDALNTWDCPCHGSRFDENGTVLQGPAVKGIKTP